MIAGTKGSTHSDPILERLKNYVKLFKLSPYRTVAGGPVRVNDPATTRRLARGGRWIAQPGNA